MFDDVYMNNQPEAPVKLAHQPSLEVIKVHAQDAEVGVDLVMDQSGVSIWSCDLVTTDHSSPGH